MRPLVFRFQTVIREELRVAAMCLEASFQVWNANSQKNRRGVPGNFFVLRQIALQYCLWACQVNYFAQIVVLVSFDVFDQFGHALIERRAFDLVEQAGWFAPFAPRIMRIIFCISGRRRSR